MKTWLQNRIQAWKDPKKWCAALIVLVAVAVGAVIASALARPSAKENPDRADAAQVYFEHAAIAVDSNRILFENGSLPKDYTDPQDSLVTETYAYAKVLEVLEDDSQEDANSENVRIGTQRLLIEITTGEHKGRRLEIENHMSKLFSKRAEVGTSYLVFIRTDRRTTTDSGAAISVSVMNYNRAPVLIALIAVFLLVTVIIGRRVGFRSILGLALTLVSVWYILVPAILKGWYPILTTLLLCVYVTGICYLLLDGLSLKSLSAILGTVAGFTVACLFAMLAGRLARLDGLSYNVAETGTLADAKYQGTPIRIRGLFVSGIVISALGAVMDVAMSISSSINELKTVNPDMRFAALYRSGMNIGRDAVGTMTNTLILAFTGSALVNLLLIRIFDWDFKAILSGDYITHEVITGISGSIGLILAVPLTALISAALCGRARPASDRTEPSVQKTSGQKKRKSR